MSKSAKSILILSSKGSQDVSRQVLQHLREREPKLKISTLGGLHGAGYDCLDEVISAPEYFDEYLVFSESLSHLQAVESKIAQLIDGASFQMVFFIGMSLYSDRLTEQLLSRGVRVLQYCPNFPWFSTSEQVRTYSKDENFLALCALSLDEQCLSQKSIAVENVGTPFTERHQQVVVSRTHLGQEESQFVISFLLEGRDLLEKSFCSALAAFVEELSIKLSLARVKILISQRHSSKSYESALASFRASVKPAAGKVEVLEGMVGEWTHVSDICLVCNPSLELTPAVAKTPYLLIRNGQKFGEHQLSQESVVNLTLGSKIVPFFDLKKDKKALVAEILKFSEGSAGPKTITDGLEEFQKTLKDDPLLNVVEVVRRLL